MTGDARYPSLTGRHVVVTGGASGIGAEIVRRLVDQGARVTFLDIDDEAAAKAAGATYRHCDLRDIAALRAAVDAAEAEAPIEVLVNNAARDDRHGFFDVQPADWDRYLAANLDHQFFATQAAAKHMRTRGRGSVILFGSISWMRARPGMVAYTAAKAAINGMTRTIARELGEYGIRVNCVVPGAVPTERQRALWRTPEGDATIMALQALKHEIVPEHVARMVLFLASAESAGCTGANFIVDGGLTLN